MLPHLSLTIVADSHTTEGTCLNIFQLFSMFFADGFCLECNDVHGDFILTNSQRQSASHFGGLTFHQTKPQNALESKIWPLCKGKIVSLRYEDNLGKIENELTFVQQHYERFYKANHFN
jgi:hypothetical protein